MNFKRGANLPGLDLSGPHFSAVVNEVEYDIIERLNVFNAWVDMSNTLNPAPILQQLHCTWLCFVRSKKNLVLRWCAEENRWELDGLVVNKRKPEEDDEGGCAAAPDGPPDQPLSGDGVELILSGGFYLPPEERKQPPVRPLRGRWRRPPADQSAECPAESEREPAAAAKRKTKRITKRPTKRIVLRTGALLRTVRRSPRFRHTLSQFEASVAEMKALGLLSRDTVHALARVAARWLSRRLADVRSLFTEDFESGPRPLAHLEPRRIEIRQGFTLVLYNFERPDWDSWLFGKLEIEIEYPNWESWLFGRPVEDEQKVA